MFFEDILDVWSNSKPYNALNSLVRPNSNLILPASEKKAAMLYFTSWFALTEFVL